MRGQYGHGSPSTVTSQAKRAISGFHGRWVSVRASGIAAMSGIVRALADVAGREAGEARPVGEQPLEVRDRHELRVRLAVHVDELREDELDAPLVELGAELVRGGGRLDGHGPVI